MPRSNLVALVCLPLNASGSGRPRHRLREWRSLAGLVAGLVLFVLASAGLYRLLHTRLTTWRDPFHARRLACLRHRALAAPRPRTVVLFGSSRTHYGVRAGSLERRLRWEHSGPVVAFNLGKPGAGPVMVLYTWQRMCRAGVRPDLVLVEVSSFQLPDSSARSDTSEVVLPATTLSADDLPFVEQYAPARLEQLREDWLTCRAAPWLGYRRVLVSSVLPRLLPPGQRHQPIAMINDCGDGPDWVSPGTAEGRLRATRATVESLAGYFAEPVPGERPARALHQLLRECHERGVRVVLLLPPEAELLRQAFPAAAVRQAERFVEELAREHGAAVVDARGWLPREDDLADGVHPTPAGAERFTERLGREVVLPWLASGR
jgi:hypothetical protein